MYGGVDRGTLWGSALEVPLVSTRDDPSGVRVRFGKGNKGKVRANFRGLRPHGPNIRKSAVNRHDYRQGPNTKTHVRGLVSGYPRPGFYVWFGWLGKGGHFGVRFFGGGFGTKVDGISLSAIQKPCVPKDLRLGGSRTLALFISYFGKVYIWGGLSGATFLGDPLVLDQNDYRQGPNIKTRVASLASGSLRRGL